MGTPTAELLARRATTCQHCGEPFHQHGTETLCSGFCAYQHLQVHYAAYGMEHAPTASAADDWWRSATYKMRDA